MKSVIDIEYLKKNNLIIFEGICGSHAYGTNIPTSDIDIRGIFILPLDNILGMNYIDQVSDKKNDIIYYEIGRFLDLLSKNNPNVLEIISLPTDCIRFKDPIMDSIFAQADRFITKKCRWSFAGYAIEQIKKARGLNKKMNWEENEMTRKTVLDFCYVLVDGGSMPVKDWIFKRHWTYKDYGLAAIDHGHDIYAMYLAPNNFLGKWGIVSDETQANDVQLTSIPKGIPVSGYLYFNKDGYSSHCKKYKEYQEWLTHRNETRVNMAKAHGKKYDGKNLMHCVRLLEMANEIALEHKLIIRRPNREKLISIRKGEYEYDDLLNEAEELIKKMDAAFEQSSLPKEVDVNFVDNLLIQIRKERYKI